MGESPLVEHRLGREQRRRAHYHVIENTVGDPLGYRDDVFRSRRRALDVAKSRAEWVATMVGGHVETLSRPAGRYLVITGRPRDAGRLFSVEECEDAECLDLEGSSPY
jgi:hypothetical protein